MHKTTAMHLIHCVLIWWAEYKLGLKNSSTQSKPVQRYILSSFAPSYLSVPKFAYQIQILLSSLSGSEISKTQETDLEMCLTFHGNPHHLRKLQWWESVKGPGFCRNLTKFLQIEKQQRWNLVYLFPKFNFDRQHQYHQTLQWKTVLQSKRANFL